MTNSNTVQMFREGDRVKRRVRLNEDLYRSGTVVTVYTTHVGLNSLYFMYAVLWDGNREPDRGYFEGGLERYE